VTDLAALADRMAILRDERDRAGRSGPFEVCFAPFLPPTATLRAGEAARIADEAAAAASLGVTWMTVGLDGVASMAEWRGLVDVLAADVLGSGS
jgi:hypothetical protein